MRTIFIAHDRNDRNFRVAGHPSLIVRFAEKSVHPFQHALCYTRRLTTPDRRTDHQYTGGQDLRAQLRPFDNFSLIRASNGKPVVTALAECWRENNGKAA